MQFAVDHCLSSPFFTTVLSCLLLCHHCIVLSSSFFHHCIVLSSSFVHHCNVLFSFFTTVMSCLLFSPLYCLFFLLFHHCIVLSPSFFTTVLSCLSPFFTTVLSCLPPFSPLYCLVFLLFSPLYCLVFLLLSPLYCLVFSFFHHCIVCSLFVHFRFAASECPFALFKFSLCLLLQYLLKHSNFVVSIVPHSCKFMVSTFRQVCRLICIYFVDWSF